MRKHPQFLRALPGIFLMLTIAVLARGGADLGLPWWPGLETYFSTSPVAKRNFIDLLHLNYILVAIILGMFVGNVFGVPRWAAAGVATSRLFIKLGVILLGSLYSVSDLFKLGGSAVIIIVGFIVLMLSFTLWLGKRIGMDTAGSATLAAGTAVCGVSAIVAVAPAVRAKSTDVVYSIATILSFGLVSMFFFPLLGTLVNLSSHQFGVWAGTGMLNSGQVLAVCLTFDPGTSTYASESLKTGEIYNLSRIIFLPFVVLFLAFFASRSAAPEDEININTGLWSKFPVFVLGFLAVVFLTSFGLLGSTAPPSREITVLRDLYNWFFAVGLAGQGLQISLAELRRAGGKPLVVGITAGLLKALLALIVVLLFVPQQP